MTDTQLYSIAKCLWLNIMNNSIDSNTIKNLFSFNQIVFELSKKENRDVKILMEEITTKQG